MDRAFRCWGLYRVNRAVSRVWKAVAHGHASPRTPTLARVALASPAASKCTPSQVSLWWVVLAALSMWLLS